MDFAGLNPRVTIRYLLNDYQKRMLEDVFALTPYLTSREQTELADKLGITKRTLQVCEVFKNISAQVPTFSSYLTEKTPAHEIP